MTRRTTTDAEERLATMARVFGEHPDNAVAWRKLCEAAIDFAKSQGVNVGRPGTVVDPWDNFFKNVVAAARNKAPEPDPATAARQNQQRQQQRAAQQRADRATRRKAEEAAAEERFTQDKKVKREPEEDDYPF